MFILPVGFRPTLTIVPAAGYLNSTNVAVPATMEIGSNGSVIGFYNLLSGSANAFDMTTAFTVD